MAIISFCMIVAALAYAAMAVGAADAPGSWWLRSLISSVVVGILAVVFVDVAFRDPQIASAQVPRALIFTGVLLAAVPFFGYCALGKCVVLPGIGWPTHRRSAIFVAWLLSLALFLPYSVYVGISVTASLQCSRDDPGCLFD